tara:strand:+ start:700 stop:1065 length:366 start_codon:yes stop_codon:yes gene_type:complete
MARKTKKLKCIVTGRELVLSRDYFQSKLDKVQGDETMLHETYICREAKDLIKRGYDLEKTRDLLGIVDAQLPDVDIKVIEDVQNSSRIKYRNVPKFHVNNYTSVKTDPEVTEFLKKVLKGR